MTRGSSGRWGFGAPRVWGRRGFTLVELMVALAIAVILLMVAVPNLNDAAPRGKLAAQANAFLATLNLARSEAIKRNGRVVVCKSADGVACTDDGGWDQGWIVFHDPDNDVVRDGTEAIIERHQPLANGFSLTGNGTVANYISFHPSGAAMTPGGAFQAATLTLCRFAPTVSSAERQIILSAAGRARVQTIEGVASCPPS